MKRFQLMLPADLYSRLRKLSFERSQSIGSLIREAVRKVWGEA